MLNLLQRLQAALHAKYEIERELGAGGMGVVFLARDRTLERCVAIKVLRPEMATAEAAERFLREARILASLGHPNVVPVHSAAEADGLFYYVMEYVAGETLAERLKRGPLPAREALSLVADVLSALEVAHARDVVHRDVKPSNIFIIAERAILVDFGIAKPTEDDRAPLTATGQIVGTPAYMAPEQMHGVATPRTDLYAVGMVLYEALTCRRWVISRSPESALLAGVPRRLARVLRRALAWSPDDRWESAKAFREALSRPRLTLGRMAIAGGGLIALAPVAYMVLRICCLPPPPPAPGYDLALLPFETTAGVTLSGEELARIVHHKLSGYERAGAQPAGSRTRQIQLVPTRLSFPWWDKVGELNRASQRLGARIVASAQLVPARDGLEVLLEVYEGSKRVPGDQRVRFLSDASYQEVSDTLSLLLARIVLGPAVPTGGTVDPEALRNFVLGESDFERGAWVPAVRYYQAAVAADPGFALAWWRLANAWRWIGLPDPLGVDFENLIRERGSDLSPADRALITAQLGGAGNERLGSYRDAYRLYQDNDFVAFLYGEELFNRGALAGFSLDSAVAVLETAVKLNPYWAATYVHLIWANIRLGRGEQARRWLDELPNIAAGPEEGWLYTPQLLEQAYRERFMPEAGATREGRERLLDHPSYGSAESLVRLARLAGGFDVPQAQLEFGRPAVKRAVHPSLRGGGHLAKALGLLGLGDAEASIAQMDSAARSFGTPEARLQAAEWVAVLTALDLSPRGSDRLTRARKTLVHIMQNDPSAERRDRAAWTLALEAGDRGGKRMLSVGASLPDTVPLGIFLTALRQADEARLRDALTTSAALLDVQAVAVPLRGSSPGQPPLSDPFARAVLHIRRGEWLAGLGDWDAAEREWLWYEAADIRGLPGADPLQPGEFDWALGTYGRFLRGLNDIERGERPSACTRLRRVEELWSNPAREPTPLLERARAARVEACS